MGDSDDENRCDICWATPCTEPVRLHCCPRHLYCRACATQWLRENPVAICLFCRREVPEVGWIWHRCLQMFRSCAAYLYATILAVEMVRQVGHSACRHGVTLALVIHMAVYSVFFAAMLLPFVLPLLLYNLTRLDQVWSRFSDMCLDCDRQPLLIPGCDFYTGVLPYGQWRQNSTRYVIYGNVVYHRAYECATYVTLTLLVVLQLLYIWSQYALYKYRGKRQFVYAASRGNT
jgi:hypothetical protein